MAGWRKFNKANEKEETKSLLFSNSFISSENLMSFEEFSPKNYEDVEPIANTLLLQKPVKLNLQDTVISDRRRIIDFLCGVAYVLSFDVKKIDMNIYQFQLNSK